MKRRRYKPGRAFGKYFLYVKETLNNFSMGGARKDRMAFFECSKHPGSFFKLPHKRAASYKNNECPCAYFEKVPRADVVAYRYNKEQARRRKYAVINPPGWLFTNSLGVFIKGKTKADDLLWYRFNNDNKCDYYACRRLENETFIYTSRSRRIVISLLSKAFKDLVDSGTMDFRNELWNLEDSTNDLMEIIHENQDI